MPDVSDKREVGQGANASPAEPIYALSEPVASPISIAPYDITTAKALIGRLRSLKQSGLIATFVTFAKAAGVTFGDDCTDKRFQEELSHWMGDPETYLEAFGEPNYRKLSTHMQSEFPYLVPNIGITVQQHLRFPLYHAIASHLSCGDRSFAQKTVQEKLAGSYVFYRPSMRTKDYGYIGRLDIAYDKEHDAYSVREQHAKDATESWDMPGAIYPISDDIFMILTANVQNHTLQIKYINNIPKASNGTVTAFSGWMSHTYQRQFYSCPYFAMKIDPARKTELRFVPIAEMPENAKGVLKRELKRHDNAYLYHE